MSTSDPFSGAAHELTPHSSARPPSDVPSMPLGAADKVRPEAAAALPSVEQITAWANAFFQGQDAGVAVAPAPHRPGLTPAASGVEAMPSLADPRRTAAAASAPIVAAVPTGLGANELTAPQRAAQPAMPYYFLAPESPTHTSDLRITKAALAAQPLDAGPGLFDAGAPRITAPSVPYSAAPIGFGSAPVTAPYATAPAYAAAPSGASAPYGAGAAPSSVPSYADGGPYSAAAAQSGAPAFGSGLPSGSANAPYNTAPHSGAPFGADSAAAAQSGAPAFGSGLPSGSANAPYNTAPRSGAPFGADSAPYSAAAAQSGTPVFGSGLPSGSANTPYNSAAQSGLPSYADGGVPFSIGTPPGAYAAPGEVTSRANSDRGLYTAPGSEYTSAPHGDLSVPAPPSPQQRGYIAPGSGYTSAPRGDLGIPATPSPRGFEVSKVRADFPILHQQINGRPLVWLDNAATTQKPNVVIERLAHFYRFENSNIHRGAHTLAARSTDAYEQARETVRRFLNAGSTEEIIFVRGATEGINLVASSWGGRYIEAGDELIVSRIEHHSNIVPWKQLCDRTGARLRVAEVDDTGQIDLHQYERLFNSHTRLVAFTHVSNALGTILPVQAMTQIAHRHGARVLIDGAQSVCHMPVDVQALDADFYVFSGHKVFGPTGIGVVYGKRALLAAMPPWQGGGNMIADVTFEKTVYQPPPMRFEAGTGNIADAVGLGAALDYLMALGLDNVARHEHELLEYGMRALSHVPGLHFVGTAKEKAAVLGFVLEDKSSEQVGSWLAERGIAVRAGHHCAQPALRRFGHETTVRPSLAMYNDTSDIDALVAALCELQDSWPAR